MLLYRKRLQKKVVILLYNSILYILVLCLIQLIVVGKHKFLKTKKSKVKICVEINYGKGDED